MRLLPAWQNAFAIVAVAATTMTSTAKAEQTVRTGDGMLSVTTTMPEEVRVGQEFTYDVTVMNASDNVTLHDIELKQLAAEGFKVESTSMKTKSAKKSKTQDKDKSKKDNKKNAAKNANDKKNAANEGDDVADSDSMKIKMLMPGESRTIEVKATADEGGELKSCLAIVNYIPAICVTSKVVKPELALTKTAPKQASRCDVIELTYTLSNGGTADVGPVVVTDSLGEGLATIEGDNELKFDVDGLKAGDSRKFVARVYARNTGEFSSRANAKAEKSDLTSRSKNTTTVVTAPDLNVEVKGPTKLYGGKLANFTAMVTNNGNLVADNVKVNVMWPKECNLADLGQPTMQQNSDASNDNAKKSGQPTPANKSVKPADATSKNAAKKKAADREMSVESFTIKQLKPGQTATFEYAVRPGQATEIPTKVEARFVCTVDSAEDKAKATDESVAMAMLTVQIVRLPALQLVVLDDEDPVQKDGQVVYSIRVWNEGQALDYDVTIKAELPKGLEFVSADGPSKNKANGQTITFEPVKELDAGDRLDYKVVAKATGDGDVRFKATLNSKSLDEGVIGEEPTRLFSDDGQQQEDKN